MKENYNEEKKNKEMLAKKCTELQELLNAGQKQINNQINVSYILY